MKRYRVPIIIVVVAAISVCVYLLNFGSEYKPGQALDSLNGVVVYYNGPIASAHGRNLSPDGYNIGIRYQCVEFVKRYYYQYLHHKMPESHGNAKDFFNKTLPDGSYNQQRDLMQYTNPSNARPAPDDLLILDGHVGNIYGHVCIVATVADTAITVTQQNPGISGSSRASFLLKKENGKWLIDNSRILGWLRLAATTSTNN